MDLFHYVCKIFINNMLELKNILKYWKTIVAVLTIALLTLKPVPADIPSFFLFRLPHFDKVVHVAMFAALAICIYVDFVKSANIRKQITDALTILCISAIYGAIIEIIQNTWIPMRSGDILDWADDVVGELIALTAAITADKRIRQTNTN